MGETTGAATIRPRTALTELRKIAKVRSAAADQGRR
jgi:hypothetical protein